MVCRQRARCRGRTRRALPHSGRCSGVSRQHGGPRSQGSPHHSSRRFGSKALPGLQALALGRRVLRKHGVAVADWYIRRYRPIVWGISAMRSCRGSSTAGMQSQRYASYFRKPRQSACRTWRSPLIRTTSRHSVSSKRMEASCSSTSSNRRSSAASLACAFASRSHDGV